MKTALITGASRGIGAATARELARQGCAVAIHYHQSEERAQALAEELTEGGAQVMLVNADVADRTQVRRMVDNVLDKFCQLDILICNAGTAWRGLLCDMTDEEWYALRGTDLDGVLYCCRAVYRHMVSRKKGRILTVSSMWGRSGASCEAAYSAAKAGVIGLTQALARELGYLYVDTGAIYRTVALRAAECLGWVKIPCVDGEGRLRSVDEIHSDIWARVAPIIST